MIRQSQPERQWVNTQLNRLSVPSFFFILSWRLLNALTINTFFQADEYWQALEPAHNAVFKYGYLTWEWKLGLRSYLHPLIYMLPYSIVKYLDLGYEWVIVTPKLINALIAAIGEYYLYYYISEKFKDKNLGKLVTYFSLLSTWNWYCWCRSFANSLELSFSIVALYYLEIDKLINCLTIAAVTCLIRPTNAILWLFYLPNRFIKNPKYLILALFIGIFMLLIDGFINYIFYGTIKLPLLNFFKFNVSDSLSSFYGVSRIDFYFFQAIPILLLNYLPFFIYGIIKTSWTDFKSLLVIYLFLFTLIPHKEFRFIYPLMPILLTYSSIGFLEISAKVSSKLMKLITLITILLSIIISFYFTQYHEVGEVRLPMIIHNKVLEDSKLHPSIGFLTPCHSTPFQSHLHLPESQANIWFLTCEPPLNSNIADYMDESDYFYKDPLIFLKLNFPQTINPEIKQLDNVQWPHEWPDYIVMFEILLEDGNIREYIGQNYEIIESLWNTPAHWDSRRNGNLLLLRYIYNS
jgi:phosphatidylinositol glycan class B